MAEFNASLRWLRLPIDAAEAAPVPRLPPSPQDRIGRTPAWWLAGAHAQPEQSPLLLERGATPVRLVAGVELQAGWEGAPSPLSAHRGWILEAEPVGHWSADPTPGEEPAHVLLSVHASRALNFPPSARLQEPVVTLHVAARRPGCTRVAIRWTLRRSSGPPASQERVPLGLTWHLLCTERPAAQPEPRRESAPLSLLNFWELDPLHETWTAGAAPLRGLLLVDGERSLRLTLPRRWSGGTARVTEALALGDASAVHISPNPLYIDTSGELELALPALAERPVGLYHLRLQLDRAGLAPEVHDLRVARVLARSERLRTPPGLDARQARAWRLHTWRLQAKAAAFAAGAREAGDALVRLRRGFQQACPNLIVYNSQHSFYAESVKVFGDELYRYGFALGDLVDRLDGWMSAGGSMDCVDVACSTQSLAAGLGLELALVYATEADDDIALAARPAHALGFPKRRNVNRDSEFANHVFNSYSADDRTLYIDLALGIPALADPAHGVDPTAYFTQAFRSESVVAKATPICTIQPTETWRGRPSNYLPDMFEAQLRSSHHVDTRSILETTARLEAILRWLDHVSPSLKPTVTRRFREGLEQVIRPGSGSYVVRWTPYRLRLMRCHAPRLLLRQFDRPEIAIMNEAVRSETGGVGPFSGQHRPMAALRPSLPVLSYEDAPGQARVIQITSMRSVCDAPTRTPYGNLEALKSKVRERGFPNFSDFLEAVKELTVEESSPPAWLETRDAPPSPPSPRHAHVLPRGPGYPERWPLATGGPLAVSAEDLALELSLHLSRKR